MAAYTEVTRQSWISRLGQSFKNVIGGIILLLIATSLLFWNEGRAVKRAKALKEGKAQVESVAPSQWANQADGRLLHTSGLIQTEHPLLDPEFNIETKSLRLQRRVETYQWKENVTTRKDKKVGGAEETIKEYSYDQVWSDQLINSSNFKVQEEHQNPTSQLYSSYLKNAVKAFMGPITISERILGRLNAFEPINVNREPGIPNSKLHDMQGVTGVYIGQGNPQLPVIGDTRISFFAVPEGDYSIVGQKSVNEFVSFTASNGNKVLLVEKGTIAAQAMFEAAEQANKTMLWVLRFVGLLIMFFGWQIIAKPIVVVGDVVPIVGNLLGLGLSVFSGVMAFTFSTIIIAFGWMAYRPLLSIVLLVIGIGVFLYFKRKGSTIHSSVES